MFSNGWDTHAYTHTQKKIQPVVNTMSSKFVLKKEEKKYVSGLTEYEAGKASLSTSGNK